MTLPDDWSNAIGGKSIAEFASMLVRHCTQSTSRLCFWDDSSQGAMRPAASCIARLASIHIPCCMQSMSRLCASWTTLLEERCVPRHFRDDSLPYSYCTARSRCRDSLLHGRFFLRSNELAASSRQIASIVIRYCTQSISRLCASWAVLLDERCDRRHLCGDNLLPYSHGNVRSSGRSSMPLWPLLSRSGESFPSAKVILEVLPHGLLCEE